MKNFGYFMQGFAGIFAAYTIPLWVMHAYFKATYIELCYALIVIQAIVSVYEAIERADRHDSVFKWIAFVVLSVAFNAALLYALVKLFGGYPAIIGYIVIKATYAGKALVARKRYDRIMSHMHALLTKATERA